jgi:hypothetical protein
MDATQNLRNEYKALSTACADSPATFNRQVERLLSKLDDGEAPRRSPSRYLEAAREVAFCEYKVDYRELVS